MKALLIIDMQLGSFRPYSLRYDTPGTIDRINVMGKQFRSKGYPVIFIQHDGSNEAAFIPGTEDWSLLPELLCLPEDIIVSKTANDSFYKTELAQILEQHKVTELYLSGCATDFCVDTTAKSALNRDYKVTVIADAHTTANRPYIDAPVVISHYNWLWADLSPAKYKMEVVKAADILI